MPVSCYGKLPIFADFIRHNHRLPELEALDMWFQEGITVARQTGKGWDDEFAQVPPAKFLFLSPATGRLTVGVWVPGVDKAGRRYPFLIFFIPEVSAMGREAVLAPLIFHDFQQNAHDLAQEGWKGLDMKAFLPKVEAVPTKGSLEQARKKYIDFITGKTAGDFWTLVFGSFEDPRKYLLPFNLLGALTPMRNGQTKLPHALRFPMTHEMEAAMWLDLTLRFAGRTALPSIFTWGPTAATVLFNDLNPKYYAPILKPDRKAECVIDLATDGQQTPGYADKAKAKFGAMMDDPSIPIRELLRRLTGRDGF